MKTKTVFQSATVKDIFAFYKESFPRRKRPLSLRQFASLLGYQSPRTIGMIIQGQRFATKTLVSRLIETAQLSGAERTFCEFLWESEELQRKDPSSKRLSSLQQQLTGLRKDGFTWRNVEKEKAKVLLEWHYAVLLAGLDSPHFPQDPEQISKLLGHRVSPLSLRESLERLADLKLIAKDSETGRWQTTNEGLVTDFDIPDSHIRKNHQTVLREAQKALEKFPVNEREYIHVAFPAPLEKIPEIKKSIRDFIVKTTHEFWDAKTPLIYRLGIYLYPETQQKPKSSTSK